MEYTSNVVKRLQREQAARRRRREIIKGTIEAFTFGFSMVALYLFMVIMFG